MCVCCVYNVHYEIKVTCISLFCLAPFQIFQINKQRHRTFRVYIQLASHVLIYVWAEQKFSITGCQKETAYDVLDNNQTYLTCTGLHPLSNIYWSFTGPSSNGTEIRLGECYVYNTTESRNNCTVFDTNFEISRLTQNFTTLRFVSNVETIHGGLIKCSQFDNDSNSRAYCAVRKGECRTILTKYIS